MNPLVSIILPTYNGHHDRLSQSIESVLGQSYKNFELIIINDASTNDIEATILKYQQQDSRIIYLKNEKNLQLTNTLNKGIQHAKGIYIARIDDDDIRCNPDKLQKQVDFMRSHPDYGLCGTSTILINESGVKIGETKTRETDQELRNHLLQSNQFAHTSIIIRKSILEKVGPYDPFFNKSEDYELRCRIGTVSKFTNLPIYGIKYRINTQGVSQKNYWKQKRLSFRVFRKYRKEYPSFWKALILRIGDYPLSEKIKNSILKYSK